MRILIFTLFLATPIFAQSLDPRYEITGSFEGAFGETEFSLTAYNDLEKSQSTVQLRDAKNLNTISIRTHAIDEEGKPTRRQYATFGIRYSVGSPIYKTEVSFKDETGIYVAELAFDNQVELADFQRDGDMISFSVQTELFPEKRKADGNYEIDSSRESKTLSGAFTGNLTDVD